MQVLDQGRGSSICLYLSPCTAHSWHRGASVARKFAQRYSVALLSRNPANYEGLVKEIEAAGGKAIGISTDCADGASVKKAFDELKKEMGGAKLTAAIYNVGGAFFRKNFLSLSEEEFVAGFEANGYVYCLSGLMFGAHFS